MRCKMIPMNLIESILSSEPREESGSKTSRKYSFQHNLSLYLLLKKHNQANDYVYLFDYHDDLMVLDSSNDPNNIDFYQMKSKDTGTWNIGLLTKRDKKSYSILGKLYFNKIKFPLHTKTLNFISNAPFNFKLTDGKIDSKTKTTIQASDLNDVNLSACTTAICNEHKITTCTDFKDITNFHVTVLSNKDCETHCLGELSNLLHSINPNHNINPKLAYDQVIGEVRRKTNTTVGDRSIENIYDLIELKGITKAKFLEFLEKAGLYRSVDDDWRAISNMLISNNIGPLELKKYHMAYRDVEIKLIQDVNKIPLQLIQNEIRSAIDRGLNLHEINESSGLMEILEYCVSKISNTLYDDYFVRCLIIKSIL